MSVRIYNDLKSDTQKQREIGHEFKFGKLHKPVQKPTYFEDFSTGNYDGKYDDDVSDISSESSKKSRLDDGEIIDKLNFIIEKLAKLEKAFSDMRYNSVSEPDRKEIREGATVDNKSYVSTSKYQGSPMLDEIRSTLGISNQIQSLIPGNPVGDMSVGTMNMTPMVEGTNQPAIQRDVVSSVGTLPSNSYDDECPNIINI